jgi:dienelactone hydrolase
LLLAVFLTGCSTLGAGTEAPLERVWQATRVWLPVAPAVSGRRVSEVEGALAAVPVGTRVQAVLYLHGCHGFDEDLSQWASLLTAAGYAVFAPDASARGDRPPVCGASTLYTRGDLPRFAQREAEARYALRQMLTLPWVVRESVVLFGFDYGGVVAAGWPGREFAGFIVTGWTCTSPDVRSGLATPLNRPLLAIRWEEDPLFRDAAWNGDCEVHLDARPGSRSLVLEGRGHSTAASPEARAAVLRFLQARTVR